VASLEVTLQAADGARLGATLFRPASPSSANGACVQVNSAAGVKQEYYAPFAEYLASRGFAVLTYDYRGVGRSVDGHVRDMPARMRDWAVLDASCAFSFLEKNYKKIFVVAHSFGGQAVAVMPGNERITAALAVGSQSCYWRLWRGGMRAGMWLLVRALLPGATKLWGYFPGALLRQGENLPPGVALEWARWCRDPRYLVGALGAEEQAAKVRSPYRLYCISDDFYAPLPAAQALLDLIENGKTEMRVVHPRELGVERIGHFGFFRERFRDTLWREAAEWLERQ
jgi:predicted alpha/beta hydrolase